MRIQARLLGSASLVHSSRLITGFTKNFDYRAMLNEDITWLSSLPGVIGVTATNSVPLSGGGSSDYIKLAPNAKGGRENLVNYFHLNEQGAAALGLKIIAGRWFTREEVQPPGATLFSPYTGPIVVTTRGPRHQRTQTM